MSAIIESEGLALKVGDEVIPFDGYEPVPGEFTVKLYRKKEPMVGVHTLDHSVLTDYGRELFGIDENGRKINE